MITKWPAILFISVLSFNISYGQHQKYQDFGSNNEIWKSTIDILLKEQLWSTRDAYDTGHILMIPLHYAFFKKDKYAINQFASFFHRFSTRELPQGQLNQVHIIYLASRYLALRKKCGFSLDNPNDIYLFKRILNYIYVKWNYDTAFQGGRKPFFGLKTRMAYIYENNFTNQPSYYKAITDYDLFIMAIASDIKYVSEGLKIIDNLEYETLKEINHFLLKTLNNRGEFTSEGGWLFQIGIWADHPDFQFSGNMQIDNNLEPNKKNNIAEDSSHSHRWPLWLYSFYCANTGEEKGSIFKIYQGFSYQFDHIVVDTSSKLPLLNNFMDGYNGVYRYKYNTVGKNNALGYGPYSLSAIVGEGWYCFLENSDKFYKKYKNSYPLSGELLSIYVGPNTTRDRNNLFSWPNFFTDGFAELIANQAYEISQTFDFQN